MAHFMEARVTSTTLFSALVNEATQELTGRHPRYFAHFPVQVPPTSRVAALYRTEPVFSRYSSAEIEKSVESGISSLNAQGISVERILRDPDEVSAILLRSILDAQAASDGLVDLRPPACGEMDVERLVPDRFVIKTTDRGARYAMSRRSGEPLLIISSTGIPLNAWARLLNDEDEIHSRVVIVQSHCSSLLHGGIFCRSRLEDDLMDLCDVCDAENFCNLRVLGWCNGARTAISLAAARPSHIASLFLACPTFHGAADRKLYPSPFEDTLPEIYLLLDQDPELADMMLNSLTSEPLVDLARLPTDSNKRAKEILRLPPYANARDLVVPCSSVETFKYYVDRINSDESHDFAKKLRQISCPVWLLTGTHDAAVNTALARDILFRCCRDVVELEVIGGGHHMHMLQYTYFRYCLKGFLASTVPNPTARVTVHR